MIRLTQSLTHFLFVNYRDILVPLTFGHKELMTDEIYQEYMEWLETDEGKQYLKGGSKYREDLEDEQHNN
jgi:hypothetical protein